MARFLEKTWGHELGRESKHYGAFIVIISPAFGYQPPLIPHTRTLMLQSASKSREGEASYKSGLPIAMGVNCVDPDNEQWASQHALSNVNSSTPNELDLPVYSPDVTSETEEKLDHKISTEESATKVEPELQENPISCLPVRASYLSAFTEVILGCEIMNNEFKHAIDDISTGGKITIYLHLKKYFCGTLFTRLCFLERPKENHKLGYVCVHGKVSRRGSLPDLLATLLAHFRKDVMDC
ncbi:hypothetical protein DKX38_012942 [Salix brachista]|uniref:Uncharacterized protein n=1 Tax=Salix brachista TaxID=2182728 RepID=A0A5N5LQA4_9ROSI|nr:hypothetical protein DKX38_012942 [Salix brachista]